MWSSCSHQTIFLQCKYYECSIWKSQLRCHFVLERNKIIVRNYRHKHDWYCTKLSFNMILERIIWKISSPLYLGCWIYPLHLLRGVRTLHFSSVLDMSLNHLMGKLQSWSFGECGISTLLPLLPSPLWPRTVGLVSISFMSKKTPPSQSVPWI